MPPSQAKTCSRKGEHLRTGSRVARGQSRRPSLGRERWRGSECRSLADGPAMTDDLPELPADAFARWDTGRDPLFYAVPRFVTHIDDQAIAAVTALYRRLFPPGGTILDLMSSWVSHLPEKIAFAEVVGHGLNRAELAANPRLTRFFVQDLNEGPRLPLDTDAFDGVGL